MSRTGPGFVPPRGLRNGFVQSVLATKRPAARLWRRRGVDLAPLSTAHVLDCGDGVRLAGRYTPAPDAPRALAVLIHGWEGSHDSSYLYSAACALHRAGYAVFRLDLRDHGGTHALNEAMFHSARIAEVIDAVRGACALAPEAAAQGLFVAGFSLGGNFALRVGLHGPAGGVHPRLSLGICPVMVPLHTLQAIDEGSRLFNRYFTGMWHATLDAKAAAWPDRFDFTRQKQVRGFVEMTRAFVEDFTEYDTLDEYFGHYTLTPQMLIEAPSPLAVITTRDDSVIPFGDFAGLSVRGSVLSFDATEYGGHCGFIRNWALESWAEARMLELFALELAKGPAGGPLQAGTP